jgi:flap endonuclease-1
MVDHGIKPCYIFDGKPPELKGGVVSAAPGLIFDSF